MHKLLNAFQTLTLLTLVVVGVSTYSFSTNQAYAGNHSNTPANSNSQNSSSPRSSVSPDSSDNPSQDRTCPAGNVKWEVDENKYEYTDNSATIVVSEDKKSVTVTPATGYEIVSICVKTGDGLSTPESNISGPYDKDISHVVVTTREIEIPQLSNLNLTSICKEGDEHKFRVRNPNDVDISFTWELYSNIATGGPLTAIANSDTFFFVPAAQPGTTKIYYSINAEDKSVTKAQNNEACSPSTSPSASPSTSPSASPSTSPSSSPSSNPSSTPTPSDNNSSNDGGSVQGDSTGAPSGEVLGTYAATGVAQDVIMNALGSVGGLMTMAGSVLYGKKSKKRA